MRAAEAQSICKFLSSPHSASAQLLYQLRPHHDRPFRTVASRRGSKREADQVLGQRPPALRLSAVALAEMSTGLSSIRTAALSVKRLG
jgi:hypothetical protein